jgi:hypothetical protein
MTDGSKEQPNLTARTEFYASFALCAFLEVRRHDPAQSRPHTTSFLCRASEMRRSNVHKKSIYAFDVLWPFLG